MTIPREGQPWRRFAALQLTPLPDDAPEWSVRDQEPPMPVTRVRSTDGRIAIIRGAECEYEGPGHSHWAYVPHGADRRVPSADSTRQDEGGWHCWLDLDFTGRCKLVDDTEHDDRPWCPCGHGEDDICLNGAIYESCGDENCGGSCSDEGGQCRSLPGCCAERTE